MKIAAAVATLILSAVMLGAQEYKVEGPQASVESKLYEGKQIGLCWAVIDYDGGSGNSASGISPSTTRCMGTHPSGDFEHNLWVIDRHIICCQV